jgi:hypothetical protein
MHIAAVQNNIDLLKHLICENYDINILSENHQTPLMIACSYNFI